MGATRSDARTATTPSRKPAGVPVGGQFATSARTAAVVDDLDMVAVEPGLSDDAIFETARREARFAGAKFNTDADDISQEVILGYLTSRASAEANGGVLPGAKGNGRQFPVTAGAQRAYIAQASRFAASRAISRNAHSSTRGAMTRLRSKASAAEQVLGRSLRDSEIDKLAEEVRNETPESSRPIKAFHRSLVQHSDIGLAYDIPDDTRYTPTVDDFEPGSLADRVERLAAEPGRAPQAAARRQAWDAIADLHGAPTAVPDSLHGNTAAKLRTTAETMGGASTVIRRWETGDETPQDEAVIFAPFGGAENLNADQKQAVIDVLHRHRDHADRLWDAAVTASTRVRVR